MLHTFRIFIMFFILGSFFSVVSIRSDDIAGLAHLFSLKIEEITPSLNMGAVYVAATNPNLRYISIREGMRKEEIASQFQTKLKWSESETASFAESNLCTMDPIEGYLFPDVYVIPENSTPDDVKLAMKNRFEKAIGGTSITHSKNTPFDLDTVIKVASLIQREAAGKRDMNLISGIIWNRLFKDSKLEIDATLQYVKGTEENWWPRVLAEDKYLDSPYNTYQNKGLPPSAISNPGIAAIAAAANPTKTSCVFYIHDRYRRIHCAKTYAEHMQNVRWFLK